MKGDYIEEAPGEQISKAVLMENLNKHISLLNFLSDWDKGLFHISLDEYFELPEPARRAMNLYKWMKPQ